MVRKRDCEHQTAVDYYAVLEAIGTATRREQTLSFWSLNVRDGEARRLAGDNEETYRLKIFNLIFECDITCKVPNKVVLAVNWIHRKYVFHRNCDELRRFSWND